jgi:hypothetical protein
VKIITRETTSDRIMVGRNNQARFLAVCSDPLEHGTESEIHVTLRDTGHVLRCRMDVGEYNADMYGYMGSLNPIDPASYVIMSARGSSFREERYLRVG